MTTEMASTYGHAAFGAVEGAVEHFVKPVFTEMRPATRAWGALIGGVALYDLTCPKGETLSEGVDRSLEASKLATTAAVGITALHLLNILPERIDPFSRFLKAIKG